MVVVESREPEAMTGTKARDKPKFVNEVIVTACLKF